MMMMMMMMGWCCSPSATLSEPLMYGGRHCQSRESVTSTRQGVQDMDDDDGAAAAAAEWRTFNGDGGDDFGMNAARLRIVGRLRTSWDQIPVPSNSTRRFTGRSPAADLVVKATRSRVNGQTSLLMVAYRVAQKCKPLPNDQNIVLNRI